MASSTPTPRPNARTDIRSAALAAVEARLRPPPSYDASIDPDPSATASPGEPSSFDATPSADSSLAPASSPSLIDQARAAHLSRNQPQPASGSSNAQAPVVRSAWAPSEKEDRELRIKFGRLLDRGIVRDNGYKQSAEAVETLLKITTNIMSSNDPKFRTLRSNNATLKNKVLDAKGGHDYLIALGFRTQRVDFSLHYVFTASMKKMHEMELGAEVLRDHLKTLQERVELTSKSSVYGASVEAARRAAALAEIEADRDAVRARVTRERIVREAREKKEREEKEKQAAAEAEVAVDRHDEEEREMREAVVRDDQEEEEEDEDADLPSYTEDRDSRGWGGPGRRLGA